MKISILLLQFLPFLLFAQLDINLKLVKSETIFNDPPFAACHASTIVELKKGKYMASWFGGSAEGKPDVGIWVAVNENGIWSSPKEIVSSFVNDTSRMPCWNPVLFKAKDGKLFLFYKQGPNPRQWWGMVIVSKDNGKTWSKPDKLPEGLLGPIKNKPIQLKNGDILCPSSTESVDQKDWKVHIEIVNPDLKSWKKILIDTSSIYGVIQPCVLLHPQGELQILCRSRQNKIVESWSSDNGLSWNSLQEINVPNPNSGIDAVTLKNGMHVMVYNPLQSGKDWWLGRNVLKVAVSKNGKDWNDVFTLENEKEGEFSYPAIIQSKDGLVHITYTANRKNIKYFVLKITK